MKHIFLIFISLMSGVFCYAEEKSDFQSNEILYAINGSEVTVVGQTDAGCKMTEVTIPATVTFESKTYTVTAVGDGAFWWNDSLVRLTIPDGVKTIRTEALYKCRNLKRVLLSKTLEVIGENAFNGCVNLDSLVLPATIKQLHAGCLGHCSRLKNIYCLASESPEFIGYNHFTSFGQLHVIKGRKQAYLDNGRWDYWYDVIDDIDLEDFGTDNNDVDDGSGKGNNQNKDAGSGNTTDEGSDSTDKPNSDKDEEQGASTAIREISTMRNQTAFSLTGVRLKTPVKGINVINGKKVFVK